MRFFFSAWVLFASASTCCAQTAVPGELLDSDHDGLADGRKCRCWRNLSRDF